MIPCDYDGVGIFICDYCRSDNSKRLSYNIRMFL